MTTTLEVATKVIRGITFPATAKDSVPSAGNVCCLRTANIQKEVIWSDVYYVDRQYVKRDEQLVQTGDILMSMANSYELVGKVAHVKSVPSPTAFGAFLSAVRPTSIIDGRYLFHFLRSDQVQLELREGSSQTTNIANISVGKLNTIKVPLAPFAEQTRIADQLDTLLAHVNACNDHLDAIPGILKRLRQTVADHACSGLLSTEWRASEKRSEWQQQQLAAMCHSISDGDHQAPPRSGDGIPFITIAAINDGHLRLDKASRFVSQQYFEGLKAVRRPKPGDLLLSVTGSIGIPALVNTDEPFTFQRHIAILKPDTSVVLSDYLWLMLRTSSARDQMLNVATGTAQLTVPLSALRKLIFKLPNLAEQAEIVRSSKKLFAAADRIEACYTAIRARTLRMAPQILAKAFRGELVEQDPSDEPASVLLARQLNQRTTSNTENVPRRPRQPRTTRAPVKSSSMTKSRQDEDVKGHPYLAGHLRRIGAPTTAQALFKEAELPVADFYKQLAWEIAEGHVKDNQTTLEPGHATG